MGRKVFSKLIPFMLVLILTVVLVAVLSAASRVSQEEAVDRYIQQAQSRQAEQQELSAPAVEGPGISFLTSLTGFMALLAIPLAALLMYARACRKANHRRSVRARRQSRRNGQDLYQQGAYATRYRV